MFQQQNQMILKQQNIFVLVVLMDHMVHHFQITIPLLKTTIIMMTLLAIGRIFYSDFGLFYQVPQNQGALFSVTNTIDTYVYRGLLELGDMSMSSAAGLYQSIVGFILVLGSNLIVKKIDPDYALF